MFDEKMQLTKLCRPFTGFDSKKKMIDLSGRNNIRGINKKAFILKKFSSAKNLKLQRSMISKLDSASFRELTDLKKVNLSKNKLKSLPSHLFFYNRKLQILNLQSNQLSGKFGKGIIVG